MELFVLILNKTEYLQDILTLFVELGISGAAVLESTGMGHIMAEDIPIFAGFKDLLRANRPRNRTIMAVVPEGKADEIIRGIEGIMGPLDDPGSGIAFTVPVGAAYGLAKGFL